MQDILQVQLTSVGPTALKTKNPSSSYIETMAPLEPSFDTGAFAAGTMGAESQASGVCICRSGCFTSKIKAGRQEGLGVGSFVRAKAGFKV